MADETDRMMEVLLGMVERFGSLEKQVAALRVDFAHLREDLVRVDQRLDKFDGRLERIERRLDPGRRAFLVMPPAAWQHALITDWGRPSM
jgi:hypothetical protein